MLLHTIKSGWQTIRNAIAAVDWPTTDNSYNPSGTVTQRTTTYMMDTTEAALSPINVGQNIAINGLELRATFNDNAGTATMKIFAAREGDTSVKLIASVALTAGTQTNASGRYYATTAVVTSYWNKAIGVSDPESGTGIACISFDTCGYSKFWVGFTAISTDDTVSVEFSGY